MSTQEQAVAVFLQSELFQNYLTLALSVLVFYDQLCTLSMEIEHMWGRKLTSVTMLFHLNRWIMFLYSAISLFTFYPLDTLASCTGMLTLVTSLVFTTYIIWAVFSAIRMFAISRGSWRLSAIVFAFSIVPAATDAYVKFGLTTYEIVPFPIRYLECQYLFNPSHTVTIEGVTATRACFVASDTLILVVTWLKTYRTKRDADRIGLKMPLATMLLRDGTVYFAVFLVLNLLNIVSDITDVLSGFFSSLLLPLQSIFISRFFLHLRQLAHGSEDSVPGVSEISFSLTQYSTVRFRSFVDNMGEQLDERSDTLDLDLDWVDDERGLARVNASIEDSVRSSQDDLESATAAVEATSVQIL